MAVDIDAGAGPLQKIIWRGVPPAEVPWEMAEAHYVDVHVPLSRRFLLLDPVQVAYRTLRVEREIGGSGEWGSPRSAWRFIIFHEDRSRASLEPPSAEQVRLRRELWDDNPSIIGDAVRCEVAEEILLDRCIERAGAAQLMIELERVATDDHGGDIAVRACLERITELAAEVRGARLLTANWPRRQRLQHLRADGGYDLSDWSPAGSKLAYLELLFDAAQGAMAFAVSPAVAAARDGGPWAAATYLVTERIEFDRRRRRFEPG